MLQPECCLTEQLLVFRQFFSKKSANTQHLLKPANSPNRCHAEMPNLTCLTEQLWLKKTWQNCTKCNNSLQNTCYACFVAVFFLFTKCLYKFPTLKIKVLFKVNCQTFQAQNFGAVQIFVCLSLPSCEGNLSTI